MNADDTDTRLSTSQLLNSTGVPCLRRHRITGRYYAVKKHRGKIKQQVMRTESGEPITDRKLAERMLRKWLDNVETEQAQKPASLTFAELLAKHRAVNAGMQQKTKNNVEWAINTLQRTWDGGLNVPVEQIKTSDVAVWLAKLDLKPASFNELSRQIKNIFALAVHDGIIAKSPYDGVLNKRKRVTKEPACIPSQEQFENIVTAIRNQRFADRAQDSADLARFLGLAALGEAEAKRLEWKHIDFEGGKMQIRRQKTGQYFEVPIYDYLKPFLQELHERRGKPTGSEKVFRVACCKRTLETVCKAHGYPHFSPRSLRKFGIVRLLRAGINVKLVAKWQGHQDGGKLILDTYSDVISEADKKFEEAELKKLARAA